jgi:hypothetical protein
MARTARNLDLGFADRSRASHQAFAILNTLQDEPLEYMAAALGLVLKTLCEVKNLSPQDIMTTADNMLKTTGLSDDNYVEALRMFIRDEVPN